MPKTPPEERIFIRNGRRIYRKTYSYREVQLGAAVMAGLVAIAAWVVYRGAHPDPELFATVIPEGKSDALLDRGPLPEELALEGWKERSLSKFDSSNLYEKINGREGFYKAFGFQFLYFASLQNEENPEIAVDIELYDLGRPENAIGAFAGEMPEGTRVDANARGLSYRTSNALFMVRGQNYLRALGSSVDPPVQDALARVDARFDGAVDGAALPWAYALFVGQLGAEVADVAYEPENAFSFGFATKVFTARRGEDTQLFVRLCNDEAAAEALAKQFQEGFVTMGEAVRGPDELTFGKDRFLGALSTATFLGPLVAGVHGAPDVETAVRELQALQNAISSIDLAAARAGSEADADEASSSAEPSGEGEREGEGEQEDEGSYEEGY